MKITIAGFPGSGKSTLKDDVAKRLDYKSYSMGDMKGKFAESKGMTIDEFMAKCPPKEVHHKVDNFQTELGQTKDNFVIDGWMSWHFIQPSLKIFLETDWNIAAQRIFQAKRGADEPTYSSVEECKKIIQERYWEMRRQTMQEYNGADLNNKDNYDVIINTSKLTEKEVAHLTHKKIIDYNQKMNPPTFYLAHPTESKEWVRGWQKGFEQRTGIKLINPFFDCNSLETEMGELGKEKYLQMGSAQRSELIRGDLQGIADKEILGGIFLFDDSYTLGTPLELALTKLMGKLTYTVAMHSEAAYQKHPTFALFSDKIFPNINQLEGSLNQNKQWFFRDLERSRQQANEDKTLKLIYDQIFKNYQYQTD